MIMLINTNQHCDDIWDSLHSSFVELYKRIILIFEKEDSEQLLSSDENINWNDVKDLRKISADIDWKIEQFDLKRLAAADVELEDTPFNDEIDTAEKVVLKSVIIEKLKIFEEELIEGNSTFFHEHLEELESLCAELGILADEEFNEVDYYLNLLERVEIGTVIYEPKECDLYIPELIISSQYELIKKIAKNPELIYRIHPRKFEEIIAEIFLKKGFEVKLTKATRDKGIDIIAIHNQMNIKTKYIIECKRYAKEKKISLGIVQRLLGVKKSEGANKAILATTSTFTKDAQNCAKHNLWDLDLKDYNEVMSWIINYNKAQEL